MDPTTMAAVMPLAQAAVPQVLDMVSNVLSPGLAKKKADLEFLRSRPPIAIQPAIELDFSKIF